MVLLTSLAAAMLCDLDDAAGDARRGTRTVPNTWGVAATWWIADALLVVSAVTLIVLAWQDVLPWRVAGPMAAAPLLTVTALHAWRPQRVRDLVDVAVPLSIAIAASAPNAVFSSGKHSAEVRSVSPEHQQGDQHGSREGGGSSGPDEVGGLGD